MIRINLLGRPRPKVKRRVAITGTLQLILLVIPLSVAILWFAFHMYLLDQEVVTLNDQVRQKEIEKAQLSQLQKEVQDYEKDQARYEGQISVINGLRGGQQGPRQLLEVVGDTVSLTDALWLTSLIQKSPNEIEFKGLARSVNAVADFMTNLDRSPYFEKVEIKEAKQQPPRDGVTNFEFTLTARFTLPAPSQEESGAAAAGG
ncbi:MAG: PilN domain-containing protein [Terriglobia bacterium]